jgi:hypothetical protein
MAGNVANTKGTTVLPVIVIGADDSVRAAFEPWISGDAPILFYKTAKEAHAALVDRYQAAELPVIEPGEDGRWSVTVAYGPKVFGPAATGQLVKLPHSGWTMLLAEGIRDTQPAPRRVGDSGDAEGEHANTMVFEAMARLTVNFVIDVSEPGALTKVMDLLTTERFAQP